ncbi:39S ribosomal protein L19, mitochondrial [Strongyloides ratti]|uniref:Large ribosomal subunit protein bL19m n=1 Tax=Strongyloides ratti TaxID=34506 RepID=A0A090L5X1_STRRB|nr:39S ribosomal protein L19, mitochondrial [Strongyloides ratti]CEF65176.1 39S ribosomal protein L19, mitochondrial [Strongyloides ratti]
MLRKAGKLWTSYRSYLPSVRFSSTKINNPEHFDEFSEIYPDFAKTPIMGRRNELRERLERADMLKRRMIIDIPEFYVGSIVAVTNSDTNLSSKQRRFVGICIRREKEGLQHTFTLRNVVDGLGVEILYELYNPTILKIETLKLEKRLDNDLSYLIDSLPEYSTFDFNLDPIAHPSGTPVPVNETKVKLRPPPWSRRWELFPYKGIDNSWELATPYKKRKLHKTRLNEWMKYDLIADYRSENKFLEHELAVEKEMKEFEEIQHKAGMTKKKILRSAQRQK